MVVAAISQALDGLLFCLDCFSNERIGAEGRETQTKRANYPPKSATFISDRGKVADSFFSS